MPKMLLSPESFMEISSAQWIMLDQLWWSIRFSQPVDGTWSMLAALTLAATADDVIYSGAVKPRLRWFKIGTRRSSSSRRGNALAVRWDSVNVRSIEIPLELPRDSRKIPRRLNSVVLKAEGKPSHRGGKPCVFQQDPGLVRNPPIRRDQYNTRVKNTLKNVSESMGLVVDERSCSASAFRSESSI